MPGICPKMEAGGYMARFELFHTSLKFRSGLGSNNLSSVKCSGGNSTNQRHQTPREWPRLQPKNPTKIKLKGQSADSISHPIEVEKSVEIMRSKFHSTWYYFLFPWVRLQQHLSRNYLSEDPTWNRSKEPIQIWTMFQRCLWKREVAQI